MNLMEVLPVELTIGIFTLLPLRDISSVSLVCKRWHQILYRSAETLSPWRLLLDRDFDLQAKPVGDEDKEWLEIYKNLAGWSWSETLKHSAVVLSDRNHVATVGEYGESYLAVLTNRPLSPGTHYFEITILEGERATEIEYGIGVGDPKVQTVAGWHDENNGVGWYSLGTLYNRGRPPTHGDVSKWDKDNYIRWFKGDREVNAKVMLSDRTETHIYLVCLMARKLSVRLHYAGRTFPAHYTLNNNIWTEWSEY